MKLSARNILKGKVTKLKTAAVAAQVHVDIGGGSTATTTATIIIIIIISQQPGAASSTANPTSTTIIRSLSAAASLH